MWFICDYFNPHALPKTDFPFWAYLADNINIQNVL